MITIINFSHPLSDTQIESVKSLTGQEIENIHIKDNTIDFHRSIFEQMEEKLQAVGFSSNDWQTKPFLVNLHPTSVGTAILLAILHGKCGYWPSILMMRRVEGSTPPVFEVYGIGDIQDVRSTARGGR